jgi:hypothetical protein
MFECKKDNALEVSEKIPNFQINIAYMRKILYFVIIELFSSCVAVNFIEPQPYESKNLMAFPEQLQGNYIASSDSMFLTIKKTQIILQFSHSKMLPREIINQQNLKINHDSMWLASVGRWAFYSQKLDSLEVSWLDRNAFFTISNSMTLRKLSNEYFLNFLNANQTWRVINLHQDKRGRLVLREINSIEQIEKIRDITTVKEIVADSGKVVEYRLNPNRKQLKQLVRAGTFTTIYQFNRMNFQTELKPAN